jgi:GT2 family glycosyltransferase
VSPVAGFSICIPLYNGGAHIDRAIASVQAQTDDDWELLLVDDASTDDSLVRARRYDDPRIRIHDTGRNVGMTRNWTRALELASSPLCLLLGQDDALAPAAIATLRAAFEAHPDVVMVGFAAAVVDIDGPTRIIVRKHVGPVAPADLVHYGATLEDTPAPSQAAFRTDAVRAAGFYDPAFSYCPEIDLQCRLGEAGGAALFLGEPLGIRSNDPARATGRLRTTPVPLRDHYRLLATHAASIPRDVAGRQRDALRRRGARLALHHLKHARVRAAASLAKHVVQGERRLRGRI